MTEWFPVAGAPADARRGVGVYRADAKNERRTDLPAERNVSGLAVRGLPLGLARLQRQVGNRAVATLLAAAGGRSDRASAGEELHNGQPFNADAFARFGHPIPAANRTIHQAVQRLPLVNAPHMDPAGDWTPTLDAVGRVERVDAKNLKLAAGVAAVPVKTGNPVTVSPPSWAFLQKPYKTALGKAGKKKAAKNKVYTPSLVGGPPHYRRMHMLNGRLGGPGSVASNLAPGSNSLNLAHSTHFETPAILILNQGLKIDTYWVKVDYNGPSAVLGSKPAKQAWEDTIWEIWGQFSYFDAAGKKQNDFFNAEEDTPKLDTKPNWKGL